MTDFKHVEEQIEALRERGTRGHRRPLNDAMTSKDLLNASANTLEALLRVARAKEQARKPFLSLFMDGRNEHGTHLLPSLPDSIGDTSEIVSYLTDSSDELAETIFADAEKLGHSTHHHVVTTWYWNKADYSLGGHEGYFEYVAVCPWLTEFFFGSPEEQERYHREAADQLQEREA